MALIGRIRKNFWFVLVLIFMALAAFVLMDMVSANQAGGNTTFVGQANRFRRWIRLRIDCIAASVSLTAVGVLARGRREPVTNQALVEELSAGSSESSSSSSSSSESSSSSSSSSSSESSSSSSSSSSS